MGGRILAVAKVLIGLGIASATVWGVLQFSGIRDTYEKVTFRPSAEDSVFARRLLESRFGTGVSNVYVPRVDRDINAVFALAKFSRETKSNLGPGTESRPDIGPTVIGFTLKDPQSGSQYAALLRFTEGLNAFIAIVPAEEKPHIQIIESRFSEDEREALEHATAGRSKDSQ